MYMICWCDNEVLENTWEIVSGEDAMQVRISELCDSGIDANDIMVFDMDDQI